MGYSLNWELLDAETFEELVFFLLEEEGFTNLEWRKGGRGVSATDGGRDLEAKLRRSIPGAEEEVSNWWVEVKYRKNTLNKNTVIELILNTANQSNLDYFLLILSGTISNPTNDWIKEYQSKNPLPKIIIWQKHKLEQILNKHPELSIRFFPKSIPLEKQLEIIEKNFWDHGILLTLEDLGIIWNKREEIRWTEILALAVILSEDSKGLLEIRKWGLEIPKEIMLKAFIIGFVNTPVFFVKKLKFITETLASSLSYILQHLLLSYDLEYLKDVFKNPFMLTDSEIELELKDYTLFWSPLISNMETDLGMYCSQNCPKVDFLIDYPKDKNISYLERFKKDEETRLKNQEGIVILDLQIFECPLNIIQKDEYCLFAENLPEKWKSEEELYKRLKFAQDVLTKKLEEINN